MISRFSNIFKYLCHEDARNVPNAAGIGMSGGGAAPLAEKARIPENDCSRRLRATTSGIPANRAKKNRHSIRRGAAPLSKKVQKREFNCPGFVRVLRLAPNVEGPRCAT
jgi:hypothetical protein